MWGKTNRFAQKRKNATPGPGSYDSVDALNRKSSSVSMGPGPVAVSCRAKSGCVAQEEKEAGAWVEAAGAVSVPVDVETATETLGETTKAAALTSTASAAEAASIAAAATARTSAKEELVTDLAKDQRATPYKFAWLRSAETAHDFEAEALFLCIFLNVLFVGSEVEGVPIKSKSESNRKSKSKTKSHGNDKIHIKTKSSCKSKPWVQALHEATSNGVLQCLALNRIVPGSIDVQVISASSKRNTDLFLSTVQSLGGSPSSADVTPVESDRLFLSCASGETVLATEGEPFETGNEADATMLQRMWSLFWLFMRPALEPSSSPALSGLLKRHGVVGLSRLAPATVLLFWANRHVKAAGEAAVNSWIHGLPNELEMMWSVLEERIGQASAATAATEAANDAMMSTAFILDSMSYVGGFFLCLLLLHNFCAMADSDSITGNTSQRLPSPAFVCALLAQRSYSFERAALQR